MSERVEVVELACGMPLLVQSLSGVRSVGVSWLVPCGSVHDTEENLGMSELLSEMLMRGAGSRDSRETADAWDQLGASRNIESGTRFMSMGASCLGENLEHVLELMADTTLRPQLARDGFESSRLLCLQQLESLADEPQERAILGARAKHYAPPFDRSGMGTTACLSAMQPADAPAHWGACVKPTGSILSVAGNVDASIATVLDRLLAGWGGHAAEVASNGRGPRGRWHDEDETNQVQIVVVHDAPPEPADQSVLERIVVGVLSGGMSGRLFSEVREKRALCYAVSASYRADRDFGSVTSYVGTTPERADEALEVLVGELERIGEGIEQDEFDRAITGLKSRLVFQGESTGARAGALSADYFKLGRARALSELTEAIDGVNLADVNEYLKDRSLGDLTIQTLGPAAVSEPAGG